MFSQQSLMWTPKIASIKIRCVYSEERKGEREREREREADGCESLSLMEEFQLWMCGGFVTDQYIWT